MPYLVQPPVEPGGHFDYSFVPPDTGTFWFHTHCNTAEQLGRGLMGVLIVEGDTTVPYDADEIVLLRDWRVDRDTGAFLDFTTRRGAHRAGTYGTVRSANGADRAALPLPASGDCRLRVLNCDPTRVMEIAVEDAEAAVIAIDGIAVPPFPLATWLLPPAARVDLVVRAPEAGQVARLVDRRVDDPLALADLTGTGAARPARPFDPAPLRAGRIAEPDLGAAETLPLRVCVGRRSFGAGDRRPAGADYSRCDLPGERGILEHQRRELAGPGPCVTAAGDRPPAPRADLSIQVEERRPDPSSNSHSRPQLQGARDSDLRDLPVHHADTVLLLPGETVEVAFVADNPGKWMFHCHVIEHQEAGMMSYLEVA